MSSAAHARMIFRVARHALPALLLASAGCAEPSEPASPAAATTAPAEPAAPAEPPPSPEALAARRAGHIAEACMNRSSQDLRRIRGNYLRQADREAGPQRLDAIAGGIFFLTARSAPDCRAAIDEAVAMQPPLPEFDTAATTYITALEAAVPVLTDASNYYTRRTYDDDQGAHGRELHTSLLRVLDAFVAADVALGDVIADIEQRSLDARVTELATQPEQRGLYLVERTHACASRTVRKITALEVSAASGDRFHLSGADGAALFAAIQACQTQTDEMIAAPETAEVDSGGSIRREANAYLAAALILARALRDDTTWNHPGEGTTLINRAIDAYNGLISYFNRM